MQKRELSNEEKQQLFQKLAQWEMSPVNQQKIVALGQALVLRTALRKAKNSVTSHKDLNGLSVDLKTFLPFDFEKNQFDVVEFQKDYFQAALTEEGIDFSKALEYKAPIMFLAQLTKSIMCTHREDSLIFMPEKIQGVPTREKLEEFGFDSEQYVEADPVVFTAIVQNRQGDINSATCRVHFKAQLLQVYSELEEASHAIQLRLDFPEGLQPDYFKDGELDTFWRQILQSADRNASPIIVE